MRTSLLLVALVAACSSSAPSGPTPSQQCSDFITISCTRDAECAVVKGVITQAGSESFSASCQAELRKLVDCSLITRVVGNADTCMADYRATPCNLYVKTTGLPVPASCNAIFR